MNLAPKCFDELPPLAWIAILPDGATTLTLLHGRHVELFETGFFEGAWEGSFADAAFDGASNVFGSGGKIGFQTVTFVGPSHTLEPLHIARTHRLTAVSNSLVFLLHYCSLKFDPYDFGYSVAFSAIIHGLERTPQEIALKSGVLTLLHHHNATLLPNGTLSVAPKPLSPSFQNYGHYVSYLRSVTAQVFQNADDPTRRYRYRPISTISSGYDSAAAAVVARDCGCRDSISFANSNRGKPDSGRPVAGVLGLHHTEFARPRRATGAGLMEAEFLATGMQGEDLIFSAFEEKLRGRILTTGFYGGNVWAKSRAPTRDIKRTDMSGCSLGEFRLRTNFLHLPIAFIGSRCHPDIQRISNAPEMAAYSVGGGYDRPIPRRILEEAGVARPLFAQKKRAATLYLFQFRRHASRSARASVSAYCRQEGIYPQYLFVLFPRLVWWTVGRNFDRVFRRLARKLKISDQSVLMMVMGRIVGKLFGMETPIYLASNPRFTILLMWAITQLEGRYVVAGRYPLSS